MGVVGIMLINGEEFLCVINKSEEVSIIQSVNHRHSVQLIQDVMFIPLQQQKSKSQKDQEEDKFNKRSTSNLISKLHKYLKEGFYFSRGYDLTASRQKRVLFDQKMKQGFNPKPIDYMACDSRYFWNKNILQSF